MGHKHSRYENEILWISDNIDALNTLSAHLESLVGSPTDDIQFNLFRIVDWNKELFSW
jgi:hypothetical protein